MATARQRAFGALAKKFGGKIPKGTKLSTGTRGGKSPARRTRAKSPARRARASPPATRSASKGLGYWMRRARMTLGATAGAVGEVLNEDGLSLREKASVITERYIGIGLDGNINVDALSKNAMGIGTFVADDWVKRKTRHYQLVGSRHALPTAGESIPYLLAWDAAGIDGTARQKAQAAHDCLVESMQGYIPSTGEYPGISSGKLRAYLLGSHGGRIGSRVISRFVPQVQSAMRDLTGWSF